MKKRLTIVFVALLCIVLCACGNTTSADTASAQPETAEISSAQPENADTAETADPEPSPEVVALNYMDIDRVSVRREVIDDKDVLSFEKLNYEVPEAYLNRDNMAWMVVTNNADFDIFMGAAILSPVSADDKVTSDNACGFPSTWIPAGECTLVLVSSSVPYDDTWRLSRYNYSYFSEEGQYLNVVVSPCDGTITDIKHVVSIQNEAPENCAVSAELSRNGEMYSLDMQNCGSEELAHVTVNINLKDIYGNNHSKQASFYSPSEHIAPGSTENQTVFYTFPCPVESAEIRYISVSVPYKDFFRHAYDAFPSEGLYLVTNY